jgi:hypothetical protein
MSPRPLSPKWPLRPDETSTAQKGWNTKKTRVFDGTSRDVHVVFSGFTKGFIWFHDVLWDLRGFKGRFMGVNGCFIGFHHEQ